MYHEESPGFNGIGRKIAGHRNWTSATAVSGPITSAVMTRRLAGNSREAGDKKNRQDMYSSRQALYPLYYR